MKGTGLANRCYDVVGTGEIQVKDGMKVTGMCIEPIKVLVEEDKMENGNTKKAFVDTKVMTRQTYTLAEISGDLSVAGGQIKFEEQDGIDYAATTV